MSAAVSGGFWPENGVATLSTIHTTSALRKLASQALSKKQTYALRELMRTTQGAAAGSTATKTLSRIANAEDLSGLRMVETETLVNRATTAGDVTDIKADVEALSSKTTFGSSPVANLDGNPLGTR